MKSPSCTFREGTDTPEPKRCFDRFAHEAHLPDNPGVADPETEGQMSALFFLFIGIGYAMSFFILACLGAFIWQSSPND